MIYSSPLSVLLCWKHLPSFSGYPIDPSATMKRRDVSNICIVLIIIGFVVSLALVAMIYTGSKAMQYMPIPLFTIFKNLTIILIAYGEKTFFGGSKVSSLMLLSFLLMVFSSVIAGKRSTIIHL
jgi:hypothetical protein